MESIPVHAEVDDGSFAAPPFGIKHCSLAEVLSLQFIGTILQDVWVLKFKSLHFLKMLNFQIRCC